MILIAIYGGLLVLLSLWMIARPEQWVDKAVLYCRQWYMPYTEILICVGVGTPFILYADRAVYPLLFHTFGWILTGVGLGLILVPPSWHRRYGIWSIQTIGRWFRPLAVGSLIFGGVLLYAALTSLIRR